MILKLIFLFALVQLLYKTEKPFLCSGVYTGIVFFIGVMTGVGLVNMAIVAGILFTLASIYFWLLNEFKEGLAHWGIMLGGLVIGLI